MIIRAQSGNKQGKAIRIGLIGSGYMGKAHALAYKSVASIFNLDHSVVAEMICTSTETGAKDSARRLGFNRWTADWSSIVSDPDIDAITIASPPELHHAIALQAAACGKAVFCEKPLANNKQEAKDMVDAVEEAKVVNMVGFNYIRTPASQLAYEMIKEGEIGEIVRAEFYHVEDYLADRRSPHTWRTRLDSPTAGGAIKDVGSHAVNAALRLVGPIESLIADINSNPLSRQNTDGTSSLSNDDQGHMLLRFSSGAIGTLTFSRVAWGRKMGYRYEITGTKGTICFDQERPGELLLFEDKQSGHRQGFKTILIGTQHPDYAAFQQGDGHGLGYNDQMVIEARDFMIAIAEGKSRWPNFADGYIVDCIIDAALRSSQQRQWLKVTE